MKSSPKFLKGGLFDKDFMQSKITTHSMSFKEKLLGYAIGPGCIALLVCMVTSLREMFYLSVMPLDTWYGSGTYLTMQIASTIFGMAVGLVVSYLAEHTVSRAGRFRPWALIGTVMLGASAVLMFWSPFGDGTTATLIWLWIVNVVLYTTATSLYNLRASVATVSTRSLRDRNLITTVKSSMENAIPGIFGAIVVTGWLYYVFLVNDHTGFWWRIFIAIPAVICIIGAFIEYFFTRERITEENKAMASEETAKENTGILQKMKAIITNKYYLISTFVGIFFAIGATLQGMNSRTYYLQFILGANEYNGLGVIYPLIAMQPMALGYIVVPLLSRKFGSRRILSISSVIVLVGVTIGIMNPSSFMTACISGLVFSAGCAAVSNMYYVVGQQAGDMVEYKSGFRLEGTLAAAIIGLVVGAITSPVSAVYETVLVKLGFDAYATVQNNAVNNWIVFVYYGGYAIQAIGIFIGMIFFDAEKHMPKVHAELKERRKAATIARGEEWIDDDERERLAWEESIRVEEENRIKDLKERCAKKGLDFETENQKELKKLEKKRAKKEAQMAKRRE